MLGRKISVAWAALAISMVMVMGAIPIYSMVAYSPDIVEGTPAAAGENVIFFDDFDDGTLDKWYVGPWNPAGVMEVTDAVSHSPNYCAHSQSDPGTNTAPFIEVEYEDTSTIQYETWVYLPVKSQEYSGYPFLRPAYIEGGIGTDGDQSSRTQYSISVRLADDNYNVDIKERNGTEVYNIFSMQPETWYKITFRIIGFHYSLFINDTLVYEGERFTDMPMNVLYVGDMGGIHGVWGDAYFDDILIVEMEPPPENVDICVSDISFSDSGPVDGDSITIQATIRGDYDIWENTSQSEVLFSDDFEDGTLDKWFIGPWNPAGVMEVTDAVSHSSNYCAHSQSDTNTNTAPYIWADFNDSSNVLVEGWLYLPQKQQEYDRFTLLQVRDVPEGASFSDPTYGLDIRLWNDNYKIDIRQVENDPDQKENITMDVYDLQPQTWHKLGIKIINNRFYVLVDGMVVYGGNRYDDRSINTIVFGDLGGSGGICGNAYLDDVKVTAFTESIDLAHKAQNATCTVSFYLDEVSESNLIHREENVFVAANGEVTVNASWTAIEGDHNIIVRLENISPEDSNASNDLLSSSIHVDSNPYIDMEISDDDINYTYVEYGDGHPCHWDTINISATVHNLGNVDGTCMVTFYMDDEDMEHMIYSEQGVQVPSGNSTTVTYQWTAHSRHFSVEGNHTIIVVISNAEPEESNLSNNRAVKDIQIGEPHKKLKVVVSSDRPVYSTCVDDYAEIVIKVLYSDMAIDDADVRAWVTDPYGYSTELRIQSYGAGVYAGEYNFSQSPLTGKYSIYAMADRNGYVWGYDESTFYLAGTTFFDPARSIYGLEDMGIMSISQSEDNVSEPMKVSLSIPVDAPVITVDLKGAPGTPKIKLHMNDEGIYGDESAQDGVFTGLLDLRGLEGTYSADIWINGARLENHYVLTFGEQSEIESFEHLFSESGALSVASESEGIFVDISLAVDVGNASVSLIKHDNGEIEMLASENILAAMRYADISYICPESSVPEGLSLGDMRLALYNTYSGEWIVPESSGAHISSGELWAEINSDGKFRVEEAPYSYEASVNPGWNLLTLTWITSPTSIEDALYSVEWDRAMIYKNGQWYTYNKNREEKFNRGFPLVDGSMGIYVEITKGSTIRGSYNTEIVSSHIHLNKGWNLMGYQSASDVKVSALLSGIPWTKIEGIDSVGNTYALSDSDYLISGRAYWIYVTEDCDVGFSW